MEESHSAKSRGADLPNAGTFASFYVDPVLPQRFCGLEAGTLSLIDMSVNLGGGVGRGHYFAMHGDFRADEELAGSVGTTVGRLSLTHEERERVREAIISLKRYGCHGGVRKYLLTGERSRYGIGMSLCDPNDIRGVPNEGRGAAVSIGNAIAGHAIPRREHIIRSKMRYAQMLNLRAGILYRRDTGEMIPAYWNSYVEALLFPQLYLHGIGGFVWTRERGISWVEHVRKRVWNVNPMFRKTPLYLAFLFDFGEKTEMHRVSEKAFIPDEVDENDAEDYCFMSEKTALGFKNICRKELSRGRRGVATASELLGKPNIFQTETMNERDMMELQTMSFRLVPGTDLTVDDVTIALMYKYRQIVLLENVIPKTSLKQVQHGSIRLEVQTGRSYRLHTHNMIRVESSDDEIMKSVSASLSSLCPKSREKYEPVSRHRCLPYKCGNGCAYGYPVLTAAERTHRVFEEDGDTVGKVVYKREIGEDGIEKDERVTPFSVELRSVRVCHGAFLICDDELATGYAGKYSFKRSGGMANEIGQLALIDIVGNGDVQLLHKEKEGWKAQMMKEKLGMRIISMMEIVLHLCGESIIYSTYFIRELWVVLPYERKKFVENGVVRKGIPDGAQLRTYYGRSSTFESETFERFYGHGCISHPADYENGVQLCTKQCKKDRCTKVMVKGMTKTLLARIMPVRGQGKFLVDMICWTLILRKVPHQDTLEVWDYSNGEHSWDVAARNGALGEDKKRLRGGNAILEAMEIGILIEEAFGRKMGQTELERQRLRDCIYGAFRDVMVNTYLRRTDEPDVTNIERIPDDIFASRSERIGLEVSACNHGWTEDIHKSVDNRSGDLCLRVNANAPPSNLERNASLSGHRRYIDHDVVSEWRNRFRSNGWKIREHRQQGEAYSTLIESLPPSIQEIMTSLKEYPSQAKACAEILDALVESPTGLRRFVTGSAGRGKSYLKKALIRIL